MKKKGGIFIFVFLAVMVVWAIQPGSLYSGGFGGNPWDFLIDPGSATGTKWSGPLSIYYKYTGLNCGTTGNNPEVILYFTVRLSHQGTAPYVFYGASPTAMCRDRTDLQGDALRLFLNDALFDIYGTPKIWLNGDWKLKSIQNALFLFDASLPGGPIIRAGTFVADIQIAINE